MNISQIFLCHASEDKEAVTRIHKELLELGFQPWLDKVDLLPGQQWEIEVPKALKSSDFVVVFLSKNSVSKRGYVQKEFKLTLDVLDEIPEGRVFVIPVKLDDCEVPERFARYHWVNLFEEGSLEKIVKVIRVHSSATNEARSALAAAEDPVELAIQKSSKDIKQLENRLLAVPEDYRIKYELLLREPKTGVVRLLPRGRYEKAMLLRGAGAYYSFHRSTHEYGYGSDIELQGRQLSSGFAGLDFGFFLVLGDVPLLRLLNASDSTPPDWLLQDQWEAWRHMWSYQPPELRREVRLDQRAYSKGVTKGGSLVIKRVASTPQTTYLLRSINIGHSDILVALRVEDFLPDDSIVLAWLVLKSFPITVPKGPDLYEGD